MKIAHSTGPVGSIEPSPSGLFFLKERIFDNLWMLIAGRTPVETEKLVKETRSVLAAGSGVVARHRFITSDVDMNFVIPDPELFTVEQAAAVAQKVDWMMLEAVPARGHA